MPALGSTQQRWETSCNPKAPHGQLFGREQGEATGPPLDPLTRLTVVSKSFQNRRNPTTSLSSICPPARSHPALSSASAWSPRWPPPARPRTAVCPPAARVSPWETKSIATLPLEQIQVLYQGPQGLHLPAHHTPTHWLPLGPGSSPIPPRSGLCSSLPGPASHARLRRSVSSSEGPSSPPSPI